MRFTRTMTVQKTSNQPRETETERVRKGKPKPPVAVRRLSEKGKEKKNCCAQCLFEGKISGSCIL